MIDVTVLIPTYRRPQMLAACLAGVDALDDPGLAWEVLVVDNDPPGALDVFERFRHGSSVTVRYLRESTTGAAHARNTGIAEARGRIIAMLDDDVVPDRSWLREVVAPIRAGEAEATAGTVILDPSVPRPRWFHERQMGASLAAFDAPDRYMGEPGDILLTANAAWLAEPLRRIGGFDPALGPRAGVPMVNDDVDLARRLITRGGRIRFVPSARVVHALPPERLRLRYVLRRAHAQGRSDWVLNRAEYEARPLHGLGRAINHVRYVWRGGRRQGVLRLPIMTSVVCAVAYGLGACREGVRWWFRPSPAHPDLR